MATGGYLDKIPTLLTYYQTTRFEIVKGVASAKMIYRKSDKGLEK